MNHKPLPKPITLWVQALSNLSQEKGLYQFLALLRAALACGLDIYGVLAGPAMREQDRSTILSARREFGDRFDYRGPLSGAAKDDFYRDLDVFVLPTAYFNEAQPLVIFEAMAAGNLIVSYDRGCIASQVQSNGLVLPRDADFVPPALAWLQDLARQDVAKSRAASMQAQNEYRRQRQAALETLQRMTLDATALHASTP